tara:strand:+ start:1110 stop:2042 length:933 start_codon:yes stop_codon:yes gene_type:complete
MPDKGDRVIQREHLQSEGRRGAPGWVLMWYGVKQQLHGADWSSALRKGELNVIFNLQGCGVVMGERTRLSLVSSTIAMCWSKNELVATRLPGATSHEFVILSIRSDWLEKTLGAGVESIFPALYKSLVSATSTGDLASHPVGFLRAMSSSERDMAMQLADPPCEEGAMPIWYAAKVSEIVALHMFRPAGELQAEPFCVSRKRVNHERVIAVHEWLERHLEQPLELQLLAGDIGCAKHYLSRFYSQQTGTTISRKLRSLRMEKAGDLLLGGKFNVTEAALAVGYNSLSHFTKAFFLEKSVKPSEYASSMES